MEQTNLKVYGYRWSCSFVFMFATAVKPAFCGSPLPHIRRSRQYYGYRTSASAFLSMSFMIVYIFVSIPALVGIDTYASALPGDRPRVDRPLCLLRGCWLQDY